MKTNTIWRETNLKFKHIKANLVEELTWMHNTNQKSKEFALKTPTTKPTKSQHRSAWNILEWKLRFVMNKILKLLKLLNNFIK